MPSLEISIRSLKHQSQQDNLETKSVLQALGSGSERKKQASGENSGESTPNYREPGIG